MLISLDIETACNQGCESACDHALMPHFGRITVVGLAWRGIYGELETRIVRDLSQLKSTLIELNTDGLVGHNLKFDLKFLYAHGIDLRELYSADTALMATASYKKVPPSFLADYEAERKEKNKILKKGFSHREAGQHSLKTLAPYFLNVDPFWETPHDHDNDEYVLKDCTYTLLLYEFFTEELRAQGTYEFYEKRLLPWSRMFLDTEIRGVRVDTARIKTLGAESEKLAAEYKKQLDDLWSDFYGQWIRVQIDSIDIYYDELYDAALRKKGLVTCDKLKAKYRKLRNAAQLQKEPFNIDSPTQLKWLLKDQLGYDIRDLSGKESTSAEVLERLAGEGKEDVALLLKYREQKKLCSTYYPAYVGMAHNDVIYGNFSLTTARTGRTASSLPNLQNVPGHLHSVFIARNGYKLITKDLSAIEPSLVAFYSEEARLVKLMQDEGDFHGLNAVALFQENWEPHTIKKEHKAERDAAKEVGLAVLYGAGAFRVQSCVMKRGWAWGEERCRAAVKALRAAWPQVTEFKRMLDAVAESEPLENLFGRKRSFQHEPDEIYMQAFNSQIQGSASDLLLHSAHRAMKEFRRRALDAHLLLTVHDEVVFEVPADRVEECDQIITHAMTDYKLETPHGPVPLRVEGKVSDCWEK